MHSNCNFPERPGRRSFVRTVVGSSLAAAAGMSSTSARAIASRAEEPGLPFHAWAPAPPMGWNSWDAFGGSITEAEYLDNARILAERLLPFGYDTATVDIQWYEAGANPYGYRPFVPLAPYSRPGAWADADMLPVGKIGLRNFDGDGHGERDTRFTRDEQVLMLTAWSCARSPLILGNDLRRLDDWTLRLVTNPEVLALLRVPGTREWHATAQGYCFVCNGPQGTWAAWLNTGEAPWQASLPAWLPDARRDCWARADLPAGTRTLTLPPHGARLVRCT